MPKKMGINSKAVEARERKSAEKKAQNEKKVKEAEDRLWQDDDKHLAKKQSRKEEEEKKKADQLRKKAEAKALLDAEMAAMKKIAKPAAAPKITRAQIDADNLKREKNVASEKVVRNVSVVEDLPPLEENYNRLMADTTIASNVDEAIAALSVSDKDSDLHPEKRLKAAYKEFETQNLPRIKTENPSLRLSQWKQILWKEWTKSPQNPLNQQV